MVQLFKNLFVQLIFIALVTILLVIGLLSYWNGIPSRANKPMQLVEMPISDMKWAPSWNEDNHYFSADGKMVAWAFQKDKKWVRVINHHIGFPGNEISVVYFSSDNQTFGYYVQLDDKIYFNYNGTYSQAYDYVTPTYFQILNNGIIIHNAYENCSNKSDTNGLVLVCQAYVVFNRTRIPAFAESSDPVFSPDNKHLAFVASVYVGNGSFKSTVVYDGIAGEIYDNVNTTMFSNDSKHLAYQAKRSRGYKEQFVILDDRVIAEHDWIGELQFSPDSSKLLFLKSYNGNDTINTITRLVIYDLYQNKTIYHQESHDAFTLKFSPDGKHIVYIATTCPSNQSCTKFLMIDGNRSKEYDYIWYNSIRFIGNEAVRFNARKGSLIYYVEYPLSRVTAN